MTNLLAVENMPGTIDEFKERFVHIIEGNRVCDLRMPPSESIMKISEFHAAFAGILNEDEHALSRIWTKEIDRVQVRDTIYRPSANRIVADKNLLYVNTFHFPDFEETTAEDRLGLFHEHIEFLFPQPDRRELFVQWLAHIIQHPEQRPKFAPLLIARQHGMGRGWLVDLMARLIGHWNVSNITMKELAGEGSGGQYHDYLHQSLFCPIHETRATEKKYAVDDKIRDKLIENWLQLNLKYGKNAGHHIYTRMFMMSNHSDALAIPSEDRRIWVHETPGTPRSEAYYTNLYQWLSDTENLRQLFWHLHRVGLTTFNAGSRAPNTPEKAAMVDITDGEVDQALKELVELLPADLWAATLPQIKLALASYDIDYGQTDDQQMAAAVKNHYAIHKTGSKDNRLKWQGRGRRVWLLNTDIQPTNDDTREALDRMNEHLKTRQKGTRGTRPLKSVH